jgi:hypothetical protein
MSRCNVSFLQDTRDILRYKVPPSMRGAQEICSSALTVKIISYSHYMCTPKCEDIRYMCTPKCDDIYVIETKPRVKKIHTRVLNRIFQLENQN